MFELSPHGHDVHVGSGPQYPWGGLYGGQIVAQALRAATMSVDEALHPHSIRAYFIRRGDASEPVRYEVDRIRNGRSFATRRVVARQAIGAILNAESSFHREEVAPAVQTVTMPEVPPPDGLANESFTTVFERRDVPEDQVGTVGGAAARDGAGRVVAWMRVTEPIGDVSERQLLHRCWLAYVSDDLPTGAVARVHPAHGEPDWDERRFNASLDHTIWYHHPLAADEWLLYDFSCLHLGGARGLSIGYVFTADGIHVATVAQEVLLRDAADRGATVAG